jgi:hypothetical protein
MILLLGALEISDAIIEFENIGMGLLCSKNYLVIKAIKIIRVMKAINIKS